VNNSKFVLYRGGVMSGWRITSVLDSLINIIYFEIANVLLFLDLNGLKIESLDPTTLD
jgi:hypothetical protein